MIARAKDIKGFMTEEELSWLASEAKRHSCIVEIGSYLGRSTRALADNTDGIVYAVDDWRGPQMWELSSAECESLYQDFLRNVADLIDAGKVIPVRADHRTLDVSIRPDMVFIDGSHIYRDVLGDILFWKERTKDGTLICGHDANFRDVRKAVMEAFGTIEVAESTEIWTHTMGETMASRPQGVVFLTIGVPHTGMIHSDTVISLLSIVGGSEWPTHTVLQHGCYVHENREKIVKEAQAVGASHVLFIDSDMYLPPKTVNKLLAHDKDIIGVNYNQREFPLVSTIKFADDKENLIPVPGDDVPKTLFKCFAVGTGCLLVKMSVFQRIDTPWFWFDTYKGDILGEDIWFCRQAHRKGIEVWCDPTIDVKHIGNYAY
jgi:predicted O-methyltransferase YrrM